MNPEVWSILTNAGPVAGIMGFMWWLERKQRVDYQTKYEKVLEDLPERLMKHATDRREADEQMVENFKKMTRACWAVLKSKGSKDKNERMSTAQLAALVSVPPPSDEN